MINPPRFCHSLLQWMATHRPRMWSLVIMCSNAFNRPTKQRAMRSGRSYGDGIGAPGGMPTLSACWSSAHWGFAVLKTPIIHINRTGHLQRDEVRRLAASAHQRHRIEVLLVEPGRRVNERDGAEHGRADILESFPAVQGRPQVCTVHNEWEALLRVSRRKSSWCLMM